MKAMISQALRSRLYVLLTLFSVLLLVVLVMRLSERPRAAGANAAATSQSPGCGTPSFYEVPKFIARSAPLAVAAGDFNRDGKTDLIVGYSIGGQVLLGNGAGGFNASTNFRVGTETIDAIAVSDFNLDGILDIAVAAYGSAHRIYVLLGSGTGSFSFKSGTDVQDYPDTIAAGDFNSDGKPDLVGYYPTDDSRAKNLSLFSGDGMGNLSASTSFTIQPSFSGFAVGDFNRDGRPDLIASTYDPVTFEPFSVLVLLGNGTGGFSSPIKSDTGTQAANGIVVGDFDRDGLSDLVLKSNSLDGLLFTPGDGTGKFGPPIPFDTVQGSDKIASGDFNGDGKPDLAVSNYDSKDIRILLNSCGVSNLADLQVTEFNLPSEVLTDSAFEFRWTVKNAGNNTANGHWVDKIYISADATPSSNDTLVATVPFTGSLSPGQTTARVQTLTLPRTSIPQNGNYYFIVVTDADRQVDETPFEGNNFNARPATIKRYPLPDLIVDSIQAPTAAFFDQTIKVQWTVKNIGEAPTDAAEWEDWVHLSTDDIPEREDPFSVVSHM